MFDVTKQKVDSKLDKIGLQFKFKLRRLKEGESYATRNYKTIFLNPEDRKCKWLAIQTEEHVLLHEIGHIVDYRYIKKSMVNKDPTFVELFGNVKRCYRRDMDKKFHDKYFISDYAQVHPADDFAEVFAVYANLEGNMSRIKKYLQKKRKNRIVYKQFVWLNKFIHSISDK